MPQKIQSLILATLSFAAVAKCYPQASDQKTFAAANVAVASLIDSARNGNTQELRAILGPGSDNVLSSGDAVADEAARKSFLKSFDEKHALVKSGVSKLILQVGEDNWPLAIPLVHAGDKWYWDTAAGRGEIVYRRIGRNELDAIRVCKGIVAAQKEYAASSHDGAPAGAYAKKITSDSGKQNGLYWEVKEGETPSPAGPLLAQASEEGYTVTGPPTPYHGYFYHVIPVENGFGFLAYPADYGNSGVMTFLVNQSGITYQKDLGDNTERLEKK